MPSCLWSQRIFPSLPGSRLTIFLSRCKFSTLTTRQPMVEFNLLTFPRFPLRKKEHKSYFGKNRTHDFRTSRCAAYLLDHSGDIVYWNAAFGGSSIPNIPAPLGTNVSTIPVEPSANGLLDFCSYPPCYLQHLGGSGIRYTIIYLRDSHQELLLLGTSIHYLS